jgi:glucokinase
MTQFIGIDLGGTNIRGGLWNGSQQIVHRIEQESQSRRPPGELVQDILAMIQELQDRAEGDIGGIGIGVPGIVDTDEGIVFASPHFPQWKEFPIREELQRELKSPLFIDNDANCAALGEWLCGAGQGKDNIICLTLGTGIGGGIIINGDVYHGERGFAAELGHIVIDADGPICNCGGRGCWELYASASGLRRSPTILAEAAGRGDELSLQTWRRFGYYLGLGIASVVNVLGIHTVVIGGRVSQSWDFFIVMTRYHRSQR